MNDHVKCFVIMPFRPELHLFYKYMKNHLETKYSIICERADTSITGEPFLDKIKEYISNAGIIISDCTEGNPNVFYELALAHLQNKKVIHISQDNSNDIPSDNKHRDFIFYKLDKEEQFTSDLDRAVDYFLVEIYEKYYQIAEKIINKFITDSDITLNLKSKDDFIKQIKTIEFSTVLPKPVPNMAFGSFIYPKIVIDENISIREKFNTWLLSQNDPIF